MSATHTAPETSMPGPHIAAKAALNIGTPLVVEGPSPEGDLAAVFEDDGETGYFYALDRERLADPILDAVCIYDVEDVEARAQPRLLHIIWSPDQTRAALLIDQHPHAVFDFRERRGYCRSGFPEPIAEHGWTRHDWNESLQQAFFPGG